MIVRNEKDNLPACLASAAGLADEIIVVDTGFTDGTQDIARSFGARVVQSDWRDDFSLRPQPFPGAGHGPLDPLAGRRRPPAGADRRAIRRLARGRPRSQLPRPTA